MGLPYYGPGDYIYDLATYMYTAPVEDLSVEKFHLHRNLALAQARGENCPGVSHLAVSYSIRKPPDTLLQLPPGTVPSR